MVVPQTVAIRGTMPFVFSRRSIQRAVATLGGVLDADQRAPWISRFTHGLHVDRNPI